MPGSGHKSLKGTWLFIYNMIMTISLKLENSEKISNLQHQVYAPMSHLRSYLNMLKCQHFLMIMNRCRRQQNLKMISTEEEVAKNIKRSIVHQVRVCNPLWLILILKYKHARIQKVLSEEVQNLILFFFSWWGDRGSKYHYKWAIIGPPAKHHLNGVSMAGRWLPKIECWLCIFVVFQGIRT